MSETMRSRISGTPKPVLPLAKMASEASKPIISSISSLTTSGWALGKSTLLITGMISRSSSIAKYTLASV